MDIVKASGLKRFMAALFDFLIVYFLASLFYQYVCSPISQSVTKIVEKTEEYNYTLFCMGYYIVGSPSQTEDGKYNLIYDFSTTEREESIKDKVKNDSDNYMYMQLNNANLIISNEQYDAYITHFYAEIGSTASYNSKKETNANESNEEDRLFTLKEGSEDEYILIDNPDEDKLKSFYDDVYEDLSSEDAISTYKDGILTKDANYINTIYLEFLFIAYVIVAVIFYFVIPLCTKYGRTVGKIIMGLGVINVKTGEPATRLQTIIRASSFIILEFLLSVIIMMYALIPLLLVISFIICAVNKKGQSIHDFIAKTTVVELALYQGKNNDAIEVTGGEVNKTEIAGQDEQ